MRVAVVVLWLAAWLAGCADSGDPEPGRIRTEAATPAGYGTIAPPNKLGLRSLYERRVDIIALVAPYYPSSSKGAVSGESDFDTWMATVDKDPDTARQMKVRNTVAQAIVDASTRNCDAYLNSLRGDQVANRTFSDILATGFGIAGGLTNPVQNAKILSSLGGFSTAFGASIDRNVFAQQAVELIADQIKKYRATERTTIEAKYSKSYADWSLGEAMADVAEYHADCSLMKGLVLTQDSLTKREALVQAARAAAQKAVDGGAAGQTVANIVDAIAQAGSDQSATASPPTPAQTQTASTNSSSATLSTADLDAQSAALSKCLAEVEAQVTAGLSVTSFLSAGDFAAGGSCANGASWDHQFIVTMNEHLSGKKLDAVSGDAKAAEFQAEESAISNEVSAQKVEIVAIRNAALGYIAELAQNGGSPNDVQTAVAQLTTPAIVANDPVFDAMKQAASVTLAAPEGKLTPGQMSAALAIAAAQAYESAVATKQSS
jgi:hypothetical protein